ncbi:FMN-dependent NADH-azoreductase [Salipaludibacillus neizhouensis]|uniref:FMN dependent NADH:quinone oxidoreductase n=1 Tax=Salipaludibacillus neizhouensis TaxID=885475 RepID=A0A3A9K4C8_9BACI|nr:NAD(P)H-dependent oxidoreductase [Salipaludibacillus neizhouensis]RKL67894.1 FMN-dependent NADH-azoreductase [Salipaludibacillus neizhouensis]
MTLLYVTANPKKIEDSFGLQLGEAFLKAYQQEKPEEKIDRLDLFKVTLPPLDTDAINMWERHGNVEQKEVTNPFVEQFLESDRIVIVTPLWNMSFPPQVKAYVDHLIIPGKTFEFTDAGIKGLMQTKKIMHIQSRGGEYSKGKLQELENSDRYLRTIFGLIGMKDYTHLFIEGTSTYPDEVGERLEAAKERAKRVVSDFALDKQ